MKNNNVPHVVYRHYNKSGELLYVGCTAFSDRRFYAQKCTKGWFGEVSRTTTEPHASKVVALAAERLAISSERPKHNKYKLSGTETKEKIMRLKSYGMSFSMIGARIGIESSTVKRIFLDKSIPVSLERLLRPESSCTHS